MKTEQIQVLTEKFLNGEASDLEKEQLNNWYDMENNKTVFWMTNSTNEEADVEARMKAVILKHVQSTNLR